MRQYSHNNFSTPHLKSDEIHYLTLGMEYIYIYIYIYIYSERGGGGGGKYKKREEGGGRDRADTYLLFVI